MYINSYVLSVPAEYKGEYLRIAKVVAEVAKDFGAIEIFENWELEVPDGEFTDYRKAVNAKAGEKIVLAWTIWPNREIAANAHEGMYNDPRMLDLGEMPFDGKYMIMGGFEPLLSFRKDNS